MKIILYFFDILDYLFEMSPVLTAFFVTFLFCLSFALLLQLTDSLIFDIKKIFKDR